jgi:hypothetical protein
MEYQSMKSSVRWNQFIFLFLLEQETQISRPFEENEPIQIQKWDQLRVDSDITNEGNLTTRDIEGVPRQV